MLIQELTNRESLEVLGNTHLGRLACARGLQPYVVPIHFACQDGWLYSLSLAGQKIDWMRANPLVCVEADQMRREQWTTVIVFGRYEELYDTPEFQGERALAFRLLQRKPMWWEHGTTKQMPDGVLTAEPVYYRIKIEQVTGRRAAIEHPESDTAQAMGAPRRQGWVRRMLRRVRKP